ncbi:MAG: hypothetical protein ACQEV6_08390 [Pseudomonadota bacterium]
MSLQTMRQKFGSIASPNRQKGASALEYLVLAAAIVFIIGLALTNDDIQTTIQGAFEGVFEDASNAADDAGGAD